MLKRLKKKIEGVVNAFENRPDVVNADKVLEYYHHCSSLMTGYKDVVDEATCVLTNYVNEKRDRRKWT